MKDKWIERELRESLCAPKHERIPGFEAAMQAAEQRLAAERPAYRPAYRIVAGMVAAIALVAIGLTLRPQATSMTPMTDDLFRIDEALMTSTYWESPSDRWLPERRFDIYREMPALPGSTESREGTLL